MVDILVATECISISLIRESRRGVGSGLRRVVVERRKYDWMDEMP
jgi:hypothetical protein